MSIQRIASRYAKSLFDLAKEKEVLEEVKKDIDLFRATAKNSEFKALLKSPIIKADKKQNVIDALFEGKMNVMTKSFIDIVLRKGRESYLTDIAHEFVADYKRFKNISTVKLVTAKKFSQEAVDKIIKKLQAQGAIEKDVQLETAIDEDLIGGFVLEFDDKLYDASVAYKLHQLSKQFSENTYIKTY